MYEVTISIGDVTKVHSDFTREFVRDAAKVSTLPPPFVCEDAEDNWYSSIATYRYGESQLQKPPPPPR